MPPKGEGTSTGSTPKGEGYQGLKFDPKKAKYVIRLKIGRSGQIEITPAKMKEVLDDLSDKCTEGGPTVDEVKITFHDPNDPIVIFILEGKEDDGTDITVSFMILKSDMYIIGYLLGMDIFKGTWNVFEDLEMANQTDATFSNRYIDKELGTEIMGNKLGARVLLKAMKQLRDGKTPEEKQMALQCICYHICEACRFDEMWNLVVPRMDDGYYDDAVIKPAVRNKLATWKATSRDLHAIGKNTMKLLKVGIRQSSDEKNERAKESLNILPIPKPLAQDFVRRKPTKGKKWDEAERDWFARGWARNKKLRLDVCTDIVRALAHPNLEMAKLIVKNSYMFLIRRDLSECCDYNGREYRILDYEPIAMSRIIP